LNLLLKILLGLALISILLWALGLSNLGAKYLPKLMGCHPGEMATPVECALPEYAPDRSSSSLHEIGGKLAECLVLANDRLARIEAMCP
jgi:hypothetical protein